jgi:hypothetical protein
MAKQIPLTFEDIVALDFIRNARADRIVGYHGASVRHDAITAASNEQRAMRAEQFIRQRDEARALADKLE